MSKHLKNLQNRAAAVSKQMRALSDITDRTPEQDAELKALVAQSGEVRQALDFEANIAKAEAELRSTIDQEHIRSVNITDKMIIKLIQVHEYSYFWYLLTDA